jgi:hypothetical protein
MSLTINGATNTITAASGLTIAGVTAVSDATDATSATAASLKTAGGLAVAKALCVGQTIGIRGSAPQTYAGIEDTANYAAGGSYYGLEVTPALTAGTTYIQGVRSRIRAATGSHTDISAVYAAMDGVTTGATVTDIYGVRISGVGSATATNQYGIHIAAFGNAASGLNYPIYSAATYGSYLAGNLAFASGKGIDFSATANGSGTTSSEVLSDYEEGTWTPAIVGSSTAGAGTYSAQVGAYTKIGNKVTVTAFLTWSAHTGTGNISIGALPFTPKNTANQIYAAFVYLNNLTLTASNTAQAYINANETSIYLNQVPVGGGVTSSIAMDTAASVIVTATYFV